MAYDEMEFQGELLVDRPGPHTNRWVAQLEKMRIAAGLAKVLSLLTAQCHVCVPLKDNKSQILTIYYIYILIFTYISMPIRVARYSVLKYVPLIIKT